MMQKDITPEYTDKFVTCGRKTTLSEEDNKKHLNKED